jgi:hypothetical protein
MPQLGRISRQLMQRVVSAALLAAFSLGFAIPLLAALNEPACEMACCRGEGASCSRRAHSSQDSAWASASCPTGCSAAISAGISHGLVDMESAPVAAGALAFQQVARLPEPPSDSAGYRAYLHQRPPPSAC